MSPLSGVKFFFLPLTLLRLAYRLFFKHGVFTRTTFVRFRPPLGKALACAFFFLFIFLPSWRTNQITNVLTKLGI